MNNNLALPKGKKNQVCVLIDESQQRYKFIDLDDVLISKDQTLSQYHASLEKQIKELSGEVSKLNERLVETNATLKKIGALTIMVAQEGESE